MIRPYRRHSVDCKHADRGRDWRHCDCPIWADGQLGGVEVRKSLGTRDWQEASQKIIKMEADAKADDGRRGLADAWSDYIDLKRNDQVSDCVLAKYELLRDRLAWLIHQRRAS